MTDISGKIRAGAAGALGATARDGGVNFAVFSRFATQMTVCLFDDDARTETAWFDLPEHDGDIWHGFCPDIGAGQLYGLRAHGPYRPDEGHRFNPNKLLMDPYARRYAGDLVWDDALYGYDRGSSAGDLSFDTRDSAHFVPKSVVSAPGQPFDGAPSPRHAHSDTVIYEAHLAGLTRGLGGLDAPGTFAALGSAKVVERLVALGITTIELLPVQNFVDDRFLFDVGLRNYWGYQTIGFFTPKPRYLASGDVDEVKATVSALHAAGIEVILDVVYNHTGEGDHEGPTLSFRGLDNRSYYRLAPDPRFYLNDAGTGNTLNADLPIVQRLILDSMRMWVTEFGIDGFRFDLCSTLGRTPAGFDPGAALFDAMRQDPVLREVRLIAEPWDLGPGGYQLGAFPVPFQEWNDKFRDGVRRFWRGDPGRAPDLAARVSGSAQQFDHSGRAATSSVNFITAHDGFTLADWVAYERKHNEANGEGNRDGHSENFSDNLGVEGPTDDPAISAARLQRRRNMMATLLLSQGTPMVLAGDEFGNSQGGNNNAYAQDNPIGWLDWEGRDTDFEAFVARLIAFRKAHPIIGQKRFLHARERTVDGIEDLFWRRADGEQMRQADWHAPGLKLVCAEMRTASGTPVYDTLEYAVFVIYNAGEAVAVRLPDPPGGQTWVRQIDTATPLDPAAVEAGAEVAVAAQSVVALVLQPAE